MSQKRFLRKKDLKKFAMKRVRLFRSIGDRLINFGAYAFQDPKWFPVGKGEFFDAKIPGE